MSYEPGEGIGQRIVVVGTTGSGKTTLAGILSALLGIPHVELDALFWRPNWEESDRDEYRERVRTALSGDAWVVDGNYGSARDAIWPRAETIVWLDFPLPIILPRIIRRTFKRALTREDLWGTNRERLRHLFQRDSLLVWAVRTHRRRCQQYEAAMEASNNAHLRFVRLRSPREVRLWLSAIAHVM